MAYDVRCGECQAPMVLKSSRHGKFYSCSRYPACKGTHSAHQDTEAPMGIPGDTVTRLARRDAHAAFDRLWKDGWMTRDEAYKWMRRQLTMTKRQAHIAELTADQCGTLIDAVNRYTAVVKT